MTPLLYVLFILHGIAKIEIHQTFLEHCSSAQRCVLPVDFITAIVVNPPERKLVKRTSVQWAGWDAKDLLLS